MVLYYTHFIIRAKQLFKKPWKTTTPLCVSRYKTQTKPIAAAKYHSSEQQWTLGSSPPRWPMNALGQTRSVEGMGGAACETGTTKLMSRRPYLTSLPGVSLSCWSLQHLLPQFDTVFTKIHNDKTSHPRLIGWFSSEAKRLPLRCLG